MKKLLFLMLGCMAAVASSAQETPFIDGDLIVMFAPAGTPQSLIERTQVVNGITTEMEMTQALSKGARIYLFHFDHTQFDQYELLRIVQEIPEVLAAQFNHIVEMRATPTDPQFGSQWHHIDGSDNDIDSDLAWNTTTGGNTGDGHNVVAAITEAGGINWAHADIVGNHWTNSHEINNNGVDDDGNGRIDDFDGWNPTGNNDNIPSAAHGTACMGMMGAAANNGNGGAGVCWNTDLMAVSFTGSLTESNVIAAYDYPYDMRVQYNNTGGALGAFVTVTSSSWGIDNANPNSFPVWCAFYDTMGAAGILSVCATTNNNVNVDVVGDMPTGCSSGYMISVTATNSSDVRTFSGFGAVRVDLGAPGESVWIPNLNSYASQSGTSFATPCVAGAVALLYSLPCATFGAQGISNPAGTALMIRDAIFNGVDVVADLVGDVATNGRLNVNNSMNLLIAQCGAFCSPQPGYCDSPGFTGGGACATSVCSYDSFCCTTSWDSICANEASTDGNCAYCLTPIGVQGCTDAAAANFDPAAECDNGSCVYCSPQAGYCDFSGYTDLGGSCAIAVCSYDSFCCNTSWDGICANEAATDPNCAYCLTPIGTQGCTNPAAANFDAGAQCDNGTCVYCSPQAGFCDASGYAGGGPCATSVCSYDSFCCNTSWDGICANEAATDANCAYCLTPIGTQGCTNPAAANYDPAAQCDNGSCLFCSAAQPGYCDATGYTDLGGPCAASVCAADSFCCNTFWDGICANAAAINPNCTYCVTPLGAFGCTNAGAVNYNPAALCDDGSCLYCPVASNCNAIGYTDLAGACAASVCSYDSFCCNTSWDSICANEATTDANCAYCLSTAPQAPVGCTNPGAVNYDSAALCDDGSCLYCPVASNCDVTGYADLAGACAASVCSYDSFCCNTSWDSLCANEATTDVNCAYCLSTAPQAPVGCTNPNAVNYDSIALCDDGSCLYCPVASNCDVTGYADLAGACALSVCSYDSFCCNTAWDSICANEATTDANCAYCLSTAAQAPAGCMDPAAINYDAAALCDDGSCLYCSPQPGYCDASGYTDLGGACATSVCGYDPFCCNTSWDGICASEAATDANCGYCLTPLGAMGCMDPAANNYDVAAQCDDGSCNYSCFGDFDNNGVVNTSDLLLLMASFGCLSSCGDFDLDGNGVVNVADMLQFMGVFGTICP